MTVGQIFTKIGSFIRNRQMFMLLNCNCAKLANFEDFKTCLGGRFFMDTVYFTKMKIALSSVDHFILLIKFCRNALKPEINHMKTNTYGLLICLQIKLTFSFDQ